jgi:hypothetical protein
MGARKTHRPRIPRPPFDPSTHAFCTNCREVKPRGAFPKNKNSKNGLHCWCLACNNGAAHAWENDPKNYRRRRDMQALNSRRYAAAKHGREVTQGPVFAKQHLPRALRAVAS